MLSFRFFQFWAVIAASIPLVLFYAGSCLTSPPCHVAYEDASNPSIVDRDGMVQLASRKQPAKKLLVWLHGTTMNGNSAPFTQMQQQLPDCHFIAPHGSEGHDGAFWFEQYSASQISELYRKKHRQFVSLRCIVPLMKGMRRDPDDPKPPISFDEAKKLYRENATSLETLRVLVKEEAQRLMKIIKVKQKELGLTNEDTIIAGLSQGGFLGLYLALTQNDPFLCMINFCGGFVKPEYYHNRSTPICFIHGIEDPYVTPHAPKLDEEILKQEGINPTIHMLPGVKHEEAVEYGLQHAIDFIKQQKLKQDPAAVKTDVNNQKLSDAEMKEFEDAKKKKRAL